jgi:cell wall-associated NlpC family hydrolase
MMHLKTAKLLLPFLLLFGFFVSKTAHSQPLAVLDPAPDCVESLNPFCVENQPDKLREQIATTARKYLGIRYRSSGKSPRTGFDCSGFTGYVFRKLGIPLKASSPAQASEGKKIDRFSARAGDLAFFGRKYQRGRFLVNHAAIVISNPGEPLSIIHSASRRGIVITRVMEDAYWRNSLLFVKTVL